MKIILRIILLIILVFPMSIHASNIKIMRLVTGDDGHSYLKKDTIELLPSKVGVASDEIKVKTVVFGNAGTGSQAFHNAPRPLYIIILSGIMQIETSKGDKHDFKAGEILLAEDLTGIGHKTRSLNDIPVSYLSMSIDK